MDINLTLIQSDLHWEDPAANRKQFSEKLQKLQEPTDLIVLPEMFSTGFSMRAEHLAEPMEGESMAWMHREAEGQNAVVMGSLIIQEGAHYYNRLIWMRPNGTYATYDKRHLFGMAKEDEVYTAGEERLVVHCKNWKICPLICYDLRFPVWSRNDDDFDLLIYIANWPQKRAAHWKNLLTARAIENQVYVVGVNRIGTDGKGYDYSGDSTVLEPAGGLLYQKSGEADVYQLNLSTDYLQEVRTQLPFLRDRDHFKFVHKTYSKL